MLERKLGSVKLAQLTARRLIAFVAEREAESAGPSTIQIDMSYVGTVLRHGSPALDVDPSQAMAALAAARGTLTYADRVAKSRRPSKASATAAIC